MASIPYTLSIPNGPNNPSADAPNMKTNTNSINSWNGVDHYTFSDSNAGQHKLVTFPNKNTPGAQIDPSSALYTANGSASTNAELYYKNAAGIFQISPLKVIGSCTTTTSNGVISLNNGFNVTSITVSNAGATYSVVVPSGIITGSNIIVFLNISASPLVNVQPAWTWNSGSNTLTINLSSLAGNTLSFSIFQV